MSLKNFRGPRYVADLGGGPLVRKKRKKYGPIARKLYRGQFPKSIFQSTFTAQNELNIVSLYLWLYEKPRRPPTITLQFLSKINSTEKKKMTVFDSTK